MTALAKVCGLTHPADVAHAAAVGADLLGFVAHPPSPRHCADLAIAEPFLERAVLVMVAAQAEAILTLARRYGFTRVQPHLPTACREAGVQLLRQAGCFVLLPWADAAEQPEPPADLYLWEPSPTQTGLPGGSGQGHAMSYPPPGPFLLAGGLAAANLVERVAALPVAARPRFRGVDAASQLERAPGRKDPAQVTAYVHLAHALECP